MRDHLYLAPHRSSYRPWAGSWLAAMVGLWPTFATTQVTNDIRSTVVAAIQADPPQTASELLSAARVLLNVGEASLAGQYLKQADSMRLAPEELTKLHDEIGSVSLLELTTDRRVADVSRPFVERIFDATRNRIRSPGQLRERVQELQQGSTDDSLRALDALRSAGSWGVAAVLQHWWRVAGGDADAGRLPAALQDLATRSPGPLMAAAQQSDPRLQELAWRTLADVEIDRQALLPALALAYRPDVAPKIRALVQQAAVRSLGRLPSRDQWADWTRTAAMDSFGRAATAVEPLTVWYWDVPTQAADPKDFSPSAGCYIWGAQRAAALIQVAPSHEDDHELYLAGAIGALQWSSGWQGAWPAGPESRFVNAAPQQRLQRVLASSLEHRWVAAAVGACRILASEPSENLLSEESPLARAIRDPEPRIRQAALDTAIAIDPTTMSAVVPVVWREARRAAAADGQRRAIVLDPHARRGDQLASLLRESRWTVNAFRTPRPAMHLLRSSPDIELILVSSDYRQPPWSEIWQQLQFDWWSRQIPIAVLYETSSPELETDPGIAAEAVFFPVPVNRETLQSLLRQLTPVTRVPRFTPAERLLLGHRPREWIARVRSSPRRYPWYAGMGDSPPPAAENGLDPNSTAP